MRLLCRRPALLTFSAALVIITLAGSSCSPVTSPTTRTPLQLIRFATGPAPYLSFSGYTQATTVVVRDQQTWQSAWQQIYQNSGSTPPLPAVDFAREMVVIAATGGDGIVLADASEADGIVIVSGIQWRPGSNCVVLAVITAPVDLARMPRRDGPVYVAIASEVRDCR
jgi:hypothetical protein